MSYEGVMRALSEWVVYFDERRVTELSELFTEDGEWGAWADPDHPPVKGRAAILAQLSGLPWRDRKHTSLNHRIDVDGDTANVLSDLLYFERVDGTWAVGGIGRYHDVLVRRGDSWFFAKRQYEMI